ncbi:DUF2062 domain-containing protein [Sodalinema gerasimenkoae]|uniref:DUF2062 domain-containing protein n=1 Tax=Sodalinema gerasimenkoae TaxID=2862348 RepID=UPI001359C208|nr:DUF2062 domain-containing protein [Sodalinema gerasimenkoae]
MTQPLGSRLVHHLIHLIERGWRITRYYYWRLIRLQDPPEYIARGVAVGVFAGCFPLFGMQTPISILLAMGARGHKLCAAVCTWISNPLTYLPIYWLNFQIGRLLLGSSSNAPSQWNSLEIFLDQTGEFFADLLLGSLVMATILAIVSYFGSLRLIHIWRLKRQLERQQNRRKKTYIPHDSRRSHLISSNQ